MIGRKNSPTAQRVDQNLHYLIAGIVLVIYKRRFLIAGARAKAFAVNCKSSWTQSGPFFWRLPLASRLKEHLSEALPIVWVTGSALLAGTFRAHWADAAARLSQSDIDRLICRGVSVCKCVSARGCVKSSATTFYLPQSTTI